MEQDECNVSPLWRQENEITLSLTWQMPGAMIDVPGARAVDPFTGLCVLGPGSWAPGTFQMAPVTTTRSEMRIKLWKMEFLGKSKAYYNPPKISETQPSRRTKKQINVNALTSGRTFCIWRNNMRVPSPRDQGPGLFDLVSFWFRFRAHVVHEYLVAYLLTCRRLRHLAGWLLSLDLAHKRCQRNFPKDPGELQGAGKIGVSTSTRQLSACSCISQHPGPPAYAYNIFTLNCPGNLFAGSRAAEQPPTPSRTSSYLANVLHATKHPDTHILFGNTRTTCLVCLSPEAPFRRTLCAFAACV